MVNVNQFGYSAGHYYYCKYLKNEYEIEYICFDRGKKKVILENVKVTYVPFITGKLERSVAFVNTVIKTSRRLKPDTLFVVYFNFCFLISIFAEAGAKILDIRTGSLIPNDFKRNVANKIIYFQSLFFPKVVILSESLREFLKIKTSKTLVLPLGSEVFYEGEHDNTRMDLLYVGSLDGRRIYETVEGFGIFLSQIPDKTNVSYTIVGFGSPEEEKKLNDTITKCGLEAYISFEGLKNYDELSPYFAKANVGIAYVPVTEYYQRQPVTKIFEYALSGLFTIATNTFENQKFINRVNGQICLDTCKSFSENLLVCYQKRNILSSTLIRNTLIDHRWKELVTGKLYSFLEINNKLRK